MENTLRLLSGAAWAYTYWRIISVSRSDRSYGMPLFAAALNLSWELIYFTGGAIYWDRYTSATHIQTAINGIWLLLDVGIAISIIRYGRREFNTSVRRYAMTLIGTIALAAALQASILLQFPPEQAARLSAFLQNIYMSGAFIAMAIARRDRRAQRLDIASTKLIGTLAPTISAGAVGGVFPAILIMGSCCLGLDFTYIVVLRELQPLHTSTVSRASIKPIGALVAKKHKRTEAQA